ncbi:TIR domain-containing protein [Saccharopolyspora sp. NPDC050389]|uniref:TIR domain-containing protein n=1 Tax=Saccharopolyspora sp. NPDC050389 TaxID=3155516 RepID=UPI0033CDC965
MRGNPKPAANRYGYDAFISYSHGADSSLATDLRNAMYRLETPWWRVRSRLRVFLDTRSLPPSDDLLASIDRELERSHHLILLAGPKSAQSAWVRHEVEFWKKHRDAKTLLIALTDGEIPIQDKKIDWPKTTALPSCLEGWLINEPHYVDLRKARTLQSPAFHSKVVDLVAGVTGRKPEEVDGQYRRQRRRRNLAVTAVLAAFIALAVIASVLVTSQRDEADRQRSVAVGKDFLATAKNERDTDPRLSLLSGLGALELDPTPEARTALADTLMQTHFEGVAARHGTNTLNLAMAANGRRAATAARVGEVENGPEFRYEVVLWETGSAGQWRRLGALPEIVDHFAPELALGADGNTLVTGDLDGVELWDVNDPRTPRRQAGAPAHGVESLALREDGTALAVSDSGGVALLDLRAPFGTRTMLPGLKQASEVVFSPDGRQLATTRNGQDGDVRDVNDHQATVWDVTDPARPARPRPVLGHFSATVFAAAFSQDGRTIATTGPNGDTVLADLAGPGDPEVLAVIKEPAGWVASVAISPDGTKLVTGDDGGNAILWDIEDRRNPKRLATLDGQPGSVLAAAFSPDGTTVFTATAGLDNTPDEGGAVYRWRVSARSRPAPAGALAGHELRLTKAAPNPADDTTMATASEDDTAILWDTTDRAHPRPRRVLHEHTDDVRGVAFSPDGNTMATASKDKTVILWNVTDRDAPTRLATLSPDDQPVNAVEFSPDGRSLITATGNELEAMGGHVVLWDVTDRGNPVRLAQLGQTGSGFEGAGEIAFHPESRMVAIGGVGLQLWNIADRHHPALLANVPEATGPNGLAFGQGGKVLAVAGASEPSAGLDKLNERSLTLLDVTDPARPKTLGTANAGNAEDVAFSPDGHTIATASGPPVLWDATDPTRPILVTDLTGHVRDTSSVAFDRSGRSLLTASDEPINTTAMLWTVGDLPDVVARATELACAAVGPGFTEQEWNERAPDLPYRRLCR